MKIMLKTGCIKRVSGVWVASRTGPGMVLLWTQRTSERPMKPKYRAWARKKSKILKEFRAINQGVQKKKKTILTWI